MSEAIRVERRHPEQQPDQSAATEDQRCVGPGLCERRSDLGRPGSSDGECKDGVQEEANSRDQCHPDDGSEQCPAMDRVECLPMEHMGLEVEHGNPDPHGRHNLNQSQAPIRKEQLEALEQHGKCADHHTQRRKQATAAAQFDDCGLHHCVIPVADRVHENADLRDQGRSARCRVGRDALRCRNRRLGCNHRFGTRLG